MQQEKQNDICILELDITDEGYAFATSIESAISQAEFEKESLRETIDSVEQLRPHCDKLDYALAASSGLMCGLIDIFLVGKPGDSSIGDATDKWVEGRVKDFAKLCGWKSEDGDASDAIKFLEKLFKIPYDQRGAGDAASIIFDLSPKNHHFKSLGHNPTLLGLFFSILNQFTNQSHFVSEGELIALQEADGRFELQGSNITAKLFCGFINWFGHLISDISGSSGSKGRGMGIPSPFWAWTNDVIAIKRSSNIPVSEFDKAFNNLALTIYNNGYDMRFQVAQMVPVFLNEIIVRTIYSVRRLIGYIKKTSGEKFDFRAAWKNCEPFSNASVKRMLTVAHGTFCLMDAGDATIRAFICGGGNFNIEEFAMRLNIIGVGRFAISLFGETKRAVTIGRAEGEAGFARRKMQIVDFYLDSLRTLSEIYNDRELVNFVEGFKSSDAYIEAFEKSVRLAELRKVPDEKILRTKSDIDNYFGGGNNV